MELVAEIEPHSITMRPAFESFADFYEREVRGVVALALALSGSPSAAEELTQDAFLAAYRRWDHVSGYDNPCAWVRRVVANLAVSRTRRWLAESRALARLARTRWTPPTLPKDDADFWAAVRHLPRRQAQVVALHYLEDRSIADIAAILDCAEGTVKAHLHKARLTLAQRLSSSDKEKT